MSRWWSQRRVHGWALHLWQMGPVHPPASLGVLLPSHSPSQFSLLFSKTQNDFLLWVWTCSSFARVTSPSDLCAAVFIMSGRPRVFKAPSLCPLSMQLCTFFISPGYFVYTVFSELLCNLWPVDQMSLLEMWVPWEKGSRPTWKAQVEQRDGTQHIVKEQFSPSRSLWRGNCDKDYRAHTLGVDVTQLWVMKG